MPVVNFNTFEFYINHMKWVQVDAFWQGEHDDIKIFIVSLFVESYLQKTVLTDRKRYAPELTPGVTS